MSTAAPLVFHCSICDERSTRICFYCTKDTCENHLCLRCNRCSDCCACEVPLEENEPEVLAEETPPSPEVTSEPAGAAADGEPAPPGNSPVPAPPEA